MRTNPYFISNIFTVDVLQLADFEDLYYATCAKLKELLQRINILLTNGFKAFHDEYFTYHCDRLDMLGPIAAGSFQALLFAFESILYDGDVTAILNRGVVQKQIHNIQDNRRDECSSAQVSAPHDVRCYYDHRGGLPNSMPHITSYHQSNSKQPSYQVDDIKGLQDTQNVSCSIIFGSLAEKYRPTYIKAGLEGSCIKREPTPDTPYCSVQEKRTTSAYISPYNLEERAKKLNAPGGPDMPCICDPDCICVPVCASDPTQNCLCEENRLFVPVTQGMDIDELDVPDLVRRNRRCSQSSTASANSAATNTETLLNQFSQITVDSDDSTPYMTVSEGTREALEGKADHSSNDKGVLRTTGPDHGPTLPDLGIWNDHDPRMLDAILATYREALRQPFSKPCAFPPKRSNVAQRLFSGNLDDKAVKNKTSLGSSQAMRIATPSESGRRVSKNSTKRSLADVSFTSLKLSLRRNSRLH